MKKINKLAIVAALGLTCASVVQAETVVVPARRTVVVERPMVVTRPIVQRPAVIGERITTTTTTRTVEPAGIPATVVSGSTLAGRREIISNNAVVLPSAGTRGRVVYSDGDGGMRSRNVRGFVSPSDVPGGEQSIAFGGTAISD